MKKEKSDKNQIGTEAEISNPTQNEKRRTRSPEEFKSLMNRLCRIEGQIKGIKKMLENDAYCPDILTQVSAANAALNSFNRVLLASHIKTCVVDDIKNGTPETVDELVNMLQNLMK